MKRYAVFSLALLLVLLFCPASAEDSPVTRSGFVAMLWYSAGSPAQAGDMPFTDVPSGSVDGPALVWAQGIGIARGTGGGCFLPEQAVTREEAAALLRRYAAYTGRSTFLPEGLARCNDYEDISPWADDSLYWATIVGIIAFTDEGRMDPMGTFTPEQAAASIRRLLETPMQAEEDGSAASVLSDCRRTAVSGKRNGGSLS